MTTVFATAVTIVVRKYYQQEIQDEKGPHPKEHDALIPPTKLENKNKKQGLMLYAWAIHNLSLLHTDAAQGAFHLGIFLALHSKWQRESTSDLDENNFRLFN